MEKPFFASRTGWLEKAYAVCRFVNKVTKWNIEKGVVTSLNSWHKTRREEKCAEEFVSSERRAKHRSRQSFRITNIHACWMNEKSLHFEVPERR